MTTPVEQPAAPVCAATGCTHEEAPGSRLCLVDERRLGDLLAQLGTEYELLSAAPSMQGREVGTIGGSTLASQRSPGVTGVMAMRDPRRGTGRIAYDDADPWGLDDTPSVFSTLAGYAEMVRAPEEEGGRGLVQPVTHVAPCLFPCMHRACLLGVGHAVPVPLTVATERRLLATHLDWIVQQDWAGEFFDEIRRLWSTLRSANGHGAPARRVQRLQTPCPSCQVRALIARPGDEQAACENCGKATSVDREKISA